MDFKTASTAEKLRWLADLLETKFADVFWQLSTERCAIGIGSRADEYGVLNEGNSGGTFHFTKKFGISQEEADAILTAQYAHAGIGRNHSMYSTTPKIAANALRRLAERYEQTAQ